MRLNSDTIKMKKCRKGREAMPETKMLEILNRIKVCIECDSLMIARDLVKLEINKLNGIAKENC